MAKFMIGLLLPLLVVVAYADYEVSSALRTHTAEHSYGLLLGTSSENFIGGPNPYFYNRIHAASDLYKSGGVKKLILSGGEGEPVAMRDALLQAGVPSAAMILDDKGVNTKASIRNAMIITEGQSFTVISQGFHIQRAAYLAKQEGLEISGYEAEDPQNPVIMVREYLSRVKAVFI